MGDYDSVRDQEVVRAKTTKAASAKPADLFTISFAPDAEGADLSLAWCDQAWTVNVQPAR